MISKLFIILITSNIFYYTQSLQSGYTCETSVALTCSESQKIIILEVIYSSECPKLNEEFNGTSIYAPSRCIGYDREQASNTCNGKQTCIIGNSPEQRPSFLSGKQANCAFKGQSINIEYSCIPDFDTSELPRIDICSSEPIDDINEGFIHTPNYPNNYPNDLTCSKIISIPAAGHRLKIYAVDFDIKSISMSRLGTTVRSDDWLEINENSEKLYGTRPPFTLLFDDVIKASLVFKSDLLNTKRSYNGFLLYFIVTPVRRSRPPKTTTVITTTTLNIEFDTDTKVLMQERTAGLQVVEPRRKSNIGLILIISLLSIVLFFVICAALLYKRRNDRRIRYVADTFKSFGTKKANPIRTNSPEDVHEIKLNFQHDFSSTTDDVKSMLKHPNDISENSDHIYSEDPLEKKDFLKMNNDNSPVYEYIDHTTVNPKTSDYYYNKI